MTDQDRFRWIIKNAGLTKRQKINIAIKCIIAILPIFEKNFPKDYRVRKAIKIAEKKNSILYAIAAAVFFDKNVADYYASLIIMDCDEHRDRDYFYARAIGSVIDYAEADRNYKYHYTDAYDRAKIAYDKYDKEIIKILKPFI